MFVIWVVIISLIFSCLKSQTEAKLKKVLCAHLQMTWGVSHTSSSNLTLQMFPARSPTHTLASAHTHMPRTHWHEYTVSKSHPPRVNGVHVVTVHDQQRAGSTAANKDSKSSPPHHSSVLLRPSVCLRESLAVFPALFSSQCRHLHNVLVGGGRWQVSVALGGGYWRCGNADDCCGDLAALAV